MKVKSKLLYVGCLLLKFLDILTTIIAINMVGLQVEANPIVRASIDFLGLNFAMAINFLFFFVLVSFAYYKKNNLLMGIIIILSAAVVFNNILELIEMRGML